MIHAQLSSTESISHPFRLGRAQRGGGHRIADGESIAPSKQKFVAYYGRKYPLARRC
jgi:hypothetical protein